LDLFLLSISTFPPPSKPCFKVNLSENKGSGERKRETGKARETVGERQLEKRELEIDRAWKRQRGKTLWGRIREAALRERQWEMKEEMGIYIDIDGRDSGGDRKYETKVLYR
jgi:hypothetical protein